MFYVGTYSTFAGGTNVESTKVKDLEKLGHSRNRASRYLDEHQLSKDTLPDGTAVTYRAVVFVMNEGFRLANSVIKLAIRQFKCDWQTAKFHCYRTHCVDVMGDRKDWSELFPEEAKPAPVVVSEPATEAVLQPV